MAAEGREPARIRPGHAGRSKRSGLLDRVLLGFDFLLMAVLGALHSLPSSTPSAWWLQLVCVAGLGYRIARCSVWRSAALAWVFGCAWLSAGVWWLFISLHRYGGLPAPLAALAVLLLSALLSLYLALAMGWFARLRRNRPLLDALLFSGCWLLAELARGLIFTGFPWAASGYAHVEGPLGRLAPWLGVYGIGWVAALLGGLLAFGARSRAHPVTGGLIGASVGGVLLLVLSHADLPAHTVPTGSLQLSLLQPNVPQEEKFAAEQMPEALEWTSAQLLQARGDLVIGPETVVPVLPAQLPEAYWQPLLKHFQRGDQAVLFGMPQGSFEAGYTNSALGISADTRRAPGGFYRYDKHHLVPFGEFIPAGFRWFTNMMQIPLGDFSRGSLTAPPFRVKGERVAPTICYEDLFGEEIAMRFRDPADAPTVLANLTNIGWFGDTIALSQHLQISRMRSLEFQMPMVRSTNTGTTAVIDAEGRVTHALATHSRGVLEVTVQGRRGLTPFAWWAGGFGLWPLLLPACLPWLLALPLRRRPG